MNTDQNNGAIKFSIAGLAACAAVFAFAQIPAIHQIFSHMLPAIFLAIAVTAWIFTVRKVKQGEDGQTRVGRLLVAAFLLADAVIAMIFAYYSISFSFQPGNQIWLQGDLRHYLYACTIFGSLATAAVSRALIPGRIFSKHKIDFLFFLRWASLTVSAMLLIVFLQHDGFAGEGDRLIYLLKITASRAMAGDFTQLIAFAGFGMFLVRGGLVVVSDVLGRATRTNRIFGK